MRTKITRETVLKIAAAVCVVILVMLAGCGDKEPQNVNITPGSANIQEGESVRFQAAALNKAGDRLPDADISWRVEGDIGTIDATGTFTATQAGEAQVVAAAGEASGRATVTVTPLPPKLASIRIEPEQASAKVGDSVNFEASGISERDREMPDVAIEWSIEGEAGSISEQGSFEALKPGEATVIARSGEFSAQAAISVAPPTIAVIRVNADREKALPGTKLHMTVTATTADNRPAAYTTVNIHSTRDDLRLSTNTLSLDESGVGVVEAHLPPEPGAMEVVFEGGEASLAMSVEATRVVRIEIKPDDDTYEAGQSVDFTAVGHDAHGNSTPVNAEWSLTGEVARIEQNGRVAMARPGDGILLASYADILTGQPFTVEAGAPAEVLVSPAEVSLQAGNTVSFEAEPRNRYGYPLLAEVAWRVEGDIGEVSGDGFFQAWKAGEGRVVAESSDAAGSAEVKVEHGPLASVIIDIQKTTITAGETVELKAYGADAHGNRFDLTPEWFISKSLGAIDKEESTFTARYAGSGEIRALADGTSAARAIEVVPSEIVRLDINPAKVDLIAGESVAFEVMGHDEFGNRVDIEPRFSMADNLGSLQENGVFKAHISGSTIVTVAANELEARATVTVEPSDMVRVTMDPPERLTLPAGQRQQFIAQGFDEFGNVVTTDTQWTVAPDLGEMGPQGSFLPKKIGKGKVTAVVTQERTGIEMSSAVSLTVDPGPTARIDLQPMSLLMEAGEEQQFSAEAYDKYGNPTGVDIQWSAVGAVGSVDEHGIFRANKARETKVRAGAGGVFTVADVQVTPSEVAFLKIVPSEITLEGGASIRLHAIGEDRFGNSTDPEVTWSLTEPEIGRIDQDGTLTGMKAGTGLVLASSRNLVDKATLRVEKSEPALIEVLPSSVTLNAGDTVNFRARGMDSGGNEIEISPAWTVKGDVGVIDGQGTFEGRIRGSGAVLAKVEDLIGEADVVVMPGAPAEILVEPESIDLSAGESQKFNVRVKDGYGNLLEDVSYSWSISPDLGIIGADDVFTAHTVGRGALKVTSRTVSIQVPVSITHGPLAGIRVRPASFQAEAGARSALEAEGYDAYGNDVPTEPVWSVTGGLGTFPEPGVFEARQSGTGHVSAAVGDVAGTADVEVKPGPVKHIDVLPRKVRLEAGSRLDFAAEAYDALGNAVPVDYAWTVGDGRAATISSQGSFISDTAHRTEVMATAAGVTGRAEVEVVHSAIDELRVTPSEVFLTAGERKNLSVSGRDRFGNKAPVETAVMTVDPERLGRFVDDNVFEAAGAGKGSITISAEGLRRVIPVKVSTGALVRIEIRLPEDDLRAANTYEFTAVGFDKGGNEVPTEPLWAVSDDIGSIDPASGQFHARKAGRALVTARSGGVTAFRWIEVNAGKLYSLFVNPNPVTLQSGEMKVFSIEGLDVEENPVDVNRDGAQWKVVGRIGSLQDPGVFVATKMGKGKVTAAIGDLIGQSYVTVEPGVPDPENSRVRLTYPILPADGASKSDILITVRDAHDNPVPEVRVTLISDRESDTLVQPPHTDKEGGTSGSIRSSKPGISAVTALVDGTMIPARTEVIFE